MPVQVLRPGDSTKPTPFTIAIVANPALETPIGSNRYVIDPIMSDRPGFDVAATNINRCLFGELDFQKEKLIADSPHKLKVKVVSVFIPGLPAVSGNALVSEDRPDISSALVPRYQGFAAFLRAQGVFADIVFLVSKSPTHRRASATYAADDSLRGGVPFTLDGRNGRAQWPCMPASQPTVPWSLPTSLATRFLMAVCGLST
jgi:hypothetical protein